MARFLKTLDNNIIASQRYFDWVITTPIMLLVLILALGLNIKKKVKMISNQKGILGGIEFAKETFKLIKIKTTT